jgi:hypothetical protein
LSHPLTLTTFTYVDHKVASVTQKKLAGLALRPPGYDPTTPDHVNVTDPEGNPPVDYEIELMG